MEIAQYAKDLPATSNYSSLNHQTYAGRHFNDTLQQYKKVNHAHSKQKKRKDLTRRVKLSSNIAPFVISYHCSFTQNIEDRKITMKMKKKTEHK